MVGLQAQGDDPIHLLEFAFADVGENVRRGQVDIPVGLAFRPVGTRARSVDNRAERLERVGRRLKRSCAGRVTKSR
jgi:hypothetical protein